MNDQKTIVIDVNLTRGLAIVLTLGLLILAFLGNLVLGHDEAAASSSQSLSTGSAGMRQYYLTQSMYDGAGADKACTSGYHFASFWEILDPSNLKYNTELGWTQSDSGQGPPSWFMGWIRTGYSNGLTLITPGRANCRNWTSNSNPDKGTHVNLVDDWDAGGDIGPWIVQVWDCPGSTLSTIGSLQA